MAKLDYIGFEGLEDQLKKLDRDSIRRIVAAGGDALAKRMQDVIEEHHHVVTGDMKRATERGHVRESIGGARTEVYPGAMHDTTSRNGFRNSSKAFVIERGRGVQPRTARSGGKVKNRTRDEFVTGDNLGYEKAAQQAMEAENERIMHEIS